ncbi:MAG: hypothetical protein P8Y23_06940, partial [Candidatus Lokiarchaeota archaeon]
SGTQTLEQQGVLIYVPAQASTNQFDLLYEALIEFQQGIRNWMEKANDVSKEDLLHGITEKMIELCEHDYIGVSSAEVLEFKRLKELKFCHDFIVKYIFSGYSAELFTKMFSKVFGNEITSNKLKEIRGDLRVAYDKMFALTEILLCAENFIGYRDLKNRLIFNTQYFSPMTEANIKIAINNAIKEIWGYERYDLLRNAIAEQQVPFFIASRYDQNVVNYHTNHAGDVSIDKNKIIGAISKSKCEILNPNGLYNPGTDNRIQGFWMQYGSIEFSTNSRGGETRTGFGIVHTYCGHKMDFLNLHSELDSAYAVNKFIFDRMESQKGVVFEDDGQTIVVYAFKFRGSSKTHYLGVAIDGKGNTPPGRIHTSFPITEDRNAVLYRAVDDYFVQYNFLIKHNVEINNM